MSEIIIRAALREGMGISRRGTAPISNAILLATGIRTDPIWRIAVKGLDGYVATIRGWTHDAIVVRDPKDGILKIGDALQGSGCVLTPIEEWEDGCLAGDRVCVWVPHGWTETSGRGAAAWWMGHVFQHAYDVVAIWRLALKGICGDMLAGRVGLYSDFYCTEGVADAFAIGGGQYPWFPNQNPTPGTTFRRLLDRRILEVEGAVAPEYRVG